MDKTPRANYANDVNERDSARLHHRGASVFKREDNVKKM